MEVSRVLSPDRIAGLQAIEQQQLDQAKRVVAQAESSEKNLELNETADGRVEIGLYGIFGFSFDIKDFELALQEADGRDLTLRIDSPGGSLSAGMAFYNAVADYDGETTAVANAMAASAASLPFLAADNRFVARGGRVMVHRSRLLLIGMVTSPLMFKLADEIGQLLAESDQDIAEILSDASELSPEEALKAMDRETWYGAERAIKAGIATGAYKGGRARTRADAQAIALAKQQGAPADWLRTLDRLEGPVATEQPYDEIVAKRLAASRLDHIRRDYNRRQIR